MDNFWVVTLFHFQPSIETWGRLQALAMDDCSALGIEEYSLNESQVDAILGERSYSGGDLPETVLDEVEETIFSRPANYRLFFDSAKNAESFLSSAQKEALCESQLQEYETQDWNAEWKKHYSPIKVNDSLEIVPSWMTDYQSNIEQKIYIYPGMGFGTGSHETTYLCLKLFTEESLKIPAVDFLDFGSGSGILGLSVFKFFPEAKVDFYDIDPEANKNCFQNAEINNFKDKNFRLVLPEVRFVLKSEYDVVFANILESILMQEKEALVSFTKFQGHLILSGLLKPQLDGIVKSYSDLGMVLLRRLEKGDWGALLFRKEN